MNKYGILIGIAGGSGSGKTFIAKSICSKFKKSEVVLIGQDSYYKNISNLNSKKRNKVNFDHPNSIDFKLLKSQLNKLINGKTIHIPIYNFETHLRSNKKEKIEKHRIIILEGIFALYDKEIRNMIDIKLYIDTPDDIRIIRRIKRDTEERGRSFSSIIEQYYNTVRPMHTQFVEQTKKFSDIIIPNSIDNNVAIDLIQNKIMTLLKDNLNI